MCDLRMSPGSREFRSKSAVLNRGPGLAKAGLCGPMFISRRRITRLSTLHFRPSPLPLNSSLMSVFLGIDIGTSGTKTLAMREDGKILASATVELPALQPQARLVASRTPRTGGRRPSTASSKVLKAGKRQAGRRQRHRPLRADARQRVPRQAASSVIRPALLWNDQRTAAECAEIEKQAGGREKLIELVANPALTGFTAPKILWLRNHEPKNFDRMRAGAAAEGLRPLPADRRVRDRSQRRLGHAAARRRAIGSGRSQLLEQARARRRRCCRRCTSRKRSAGKLSRDRGEAAGAARRRAGRRRRRRSGGRRRRQRHRRDAASSPPRWAPAASSSPTATKCRSTRRAACTRSATPSAASGT